MAPALLDAGPRHCRRPQPGGGPAAGPGAAPGAVRRARPGALAGPLAMGGSSSSHGAGLAGRRTQSSGSLCTADKLGRLVACGRHRHRCARQGSHHHHHHDDGGGGDSRRHLRYKLCGSLPSHLDAAQLAQRDLDGHYERCDNNNITPASPAASEKDLQDLGYASERSPDEDKLLPPGLAAGACEAVVLRRGSRGLGFSVCGGADCAPDGLVRIKRVFPHEPAWQSGRLRPGDVLLAVNDRPLSGLSNHEALEVLRTAADDVVLTVVRSPCPPAWAGACNGAPLAPPPPNGILHKPCNGPLSGRQPPRHLKPPDQCDPRHQDTYGELEVVLTKVQGSLGFTLRKEDSPAPGHYVRALVREPALSDGRIRPGDKIVAVNGVDMGRMTHEEAVLFLRQAGDPVRLTLHREALSPTEAFRPKALRKEALDMLSDLATRRSAPASGSSGLRCGLRPGESATLGRPRKVSEGSCRAVQGVPPQHWQQAPRAADRLRTRTRSFGEQPPHRSYETLSCSSHHTGRELSPLVDSTVSSSSLSSLSSANSVLARPASQGPPRGGPRRPDSLTLRPERAAAPGAPAAPAWHLQRLTLTAPHVAQPWVDDGRLSDFSSLPCDTVGAGAAGTARDGGAEGLHFGHRHPAYLSEGPGGRGGRGHGVGAARDGGSELPTAAACERLNRESAQDEGDVGGGRTGLLKWKGVVFSKQSESDSAPDQDDTASQSTLEDSNGVIFTVELNRGWNSRLGFSIQGQGNHSVISAIYNDSVAAKNGKLRIGDRLIMVNDMSVDGMATSDVIDLFRKMRGPIAITVLREDTI